MDSINLNSESYTNNEIEKLLLIKKVREDKKLLNILYLKYYILYLVFYNNLPK